jgi:hypothetical protein
VTKEESVRVRVGFVVLWTVIGLGLLVAATVLVGGWDDPQFWSSVLVNLGTTIFLAGFLVWLERRFVATARTVAKDAATTAASEAATVAAEEATRVLSERLDAIQDRFERHRAEQVERENSTVAGLAEEISFDQVLSAMTLAESMGAASSPLFATAGVGIDAPVVGIALAWEEVPPYDPSPPEVEGLVLSLDTTGYDTSYVVETNWSEDDDPVTVLGRLRTEMISVGYGPDSQRLEFDHFFENLRVGLEDGVAGRRGDVGSWRTSGRLLDIISKDWVISDNGVEHREHGVVASRNVLAAQSGPGFPFTTPPPPDGVDQTVWSSVAKRARRRLWRSSHWGS